MIESSKPTGVGNGPQAAARRLYRCPASGAELVDAGDALVCCDPRRRLRYPVVDGIPVLLVDEAAELCPADWAAAMAAAGRDPVLERSVVADAPTAGRSGG